MILLQKRIHKINDKKKMVWMLVFRQWYLFLVKWVWPSVMFALPRFSMHINSHFEYLLDMAHTAHISDTFVHRHVQGWTVNLYVQIICEHFLPNILFRNWPKQKHLHFWTRIVQHNHKQYFWWLLLARKHRTTFSEILLFFHLEWLRTDVKLFFAARWKHWNSTVSYFTLHIL